MNVKVVRVILEGSVLPYFREWKWELKDVIQETMRNVDGESFRLWDSFEVVEIKVLKSIKKDL
jgi:hypothetical protein